MTVRLACEVDRDAWNAFVAASPSGNFRQVYEWGEVRRLLGWEPVRLVAEEGTAVLGAIQMLGRRIPGTGLRLFYAPRGPVLADGARVEAFDALMCEAAAQAAARGGILLRTDPEPADSGQAVADWLTDCGFRLLPKAWSYWNCYTYSLRVSLDRSEDELLASFRSNQRRNIRRAERAAVKVVVAAERDDMRVLHRLWSEAGKRANFPVRELHYYEALWDCLVTRGLARLFMAWHEDVPVAAGFFVLAGKRAWYLYGASDACRREVRPSEALFWGAMRYLRERGFRWLDLLPAAGARPHEAGDTLWHFKMGFRPEVVKFPGYFDRPLRAVPYGVWRLLEDRGLPLADRALQLGRALRRRREAWAGGAKGARAEISRSSTAASQNGGM